MVASSFLCGALPAPGLGAQEATGVLLWQIGCRQGCLYWQRGAMIGSGGFVSEGAQPRPPILPAPGVVQSAGS